MAPTVIFQTNVVSNSCQGEQKWMVAPLQVDRTVTMQVTVALMIIVGPMV